MSSKLKILITGFILSLFFACKKYPEGPKVSLRTVHHRLTGTYELDKFIVNGIDSTALLPPCNIAYSLNYTTTDGRYYFLFKDGYPDNLSGLDHNGGYSLTSNKKNIYIAYGSGSNYGGIFTSGRNILEPAKGSDGQWEIRKLTKKEFWIKQVYNSLVFEVRLKKIHAL